MPLTLIPPSKARRTPYFSVRGTYLGIHVDRSTKADRETVAKKVLKLWKEQIERGEYRSGREVESPKPQDEMTFAGAAVAYMNAGGERRYLTEAIDQLGRKPLSQIDQATIDAAAVAAFPKGSPAYRNRNFYTPVSAVLKHVGIEKTIRRPKGWRGKKATTWLEPEQAFAIFKAAAAIDREFEIMLRTFCYTGVRLGDLAGPKGVKLSRVNLKRQHFYVGDPKNGEPRMVYIPKALLPHLANHPRGLDRDDSVRLFRFGINGRTRQLLKQTLAKADIKLPPRQGGFHVFCHTWGTWMRRYGSLDTFDLVDTGRWKDPASAKRYAHTDVPEIARRADLLPVEHRKSGVVKRT